MNHKRLIPILAAVLAVLMLAGCGIGRESVQDNSTPEGLQTFGVAVNPSAQPSMAQEVSPNVTMPDGSTGGEPGQNDQGENGGTTSPSPSQSGNNGGNGNGGNGGNNGGNGGNNGGNGGNNGGGTTPTVSPSTSPAVSPPQPASTATYDEVMEYVGKQLSELIDKRGYPVRSDYDYVDEKEPSQGEIGTLYFSGGFTVTTLRNSDGEVITGISQKDE